MPKSARGVAYFEFEDLCQQALGQRTTLPSAINFIRWFSAAYRKIATEMRNEAKRFMNLIDVLYEGHRVGSPMRPEELHAAGTHAFEFQRTVSRLMEMQSPSILISHTNRPTDEI